METFTFYWRTGRREVLDGENPSDAMNRAGYGYGAVRALDFYAEGDNKEYEWRKGDGGWQRK